MKFKQKDIKIFVKKSLQRVFLHYGRTEKYVNLMDSDASQAIADLLEQNRPAMICRFGSNEIQTIIAYLKEIRPLSSKKFYHSFHWGDRLHDMHVTAGFYPIDDMELIYKFCDLMLRDTSEIDILGSWRKEEYYLKKLLKNVKRVRLRILEPYFNKVPWSRLLTNKKVLVIHPFADTIQQQYRKRKLLFNDSRILPDFELITLKAVQSIGGQPDPRFPTWFDALEFMKSEMDNIDYDIALIGCGAYGFPLAAHAKRTGKIGIHIGGALQILFGIFGKRWDSRPEFVQFKNEHWIYPPKNDIPSNLKKIEENEGPAYW